MRRAHRLAGFGKVLVIHIASFAMTLGDDDLTIVWRSKWTAMRPTGVDHSVPATWCLAFESSQSVRCLDASRSRANREPRRSTTTLESEVHSQRDPSQLMLPRERESDLPSQPSRKETVGVEAKWFAPVEVDANTRAHCVEEVWLPFRR